MTHEISLYETFGRTASDGELACAFRLKELDRYYSMCDQIILDFTNFRMSNSSFMNASSLLTLRNTERKHLRKSALKAVEER